MDLADRNPEGYARADNRTLAANLEGKLLLIHGTLDGSVPFGTLMKLVSSFVQAERFVDLVILPDHDHTARYLGRGRTTPYWGEVVRRYFGEHLQPETATPPG